ncbi:MAG: 1-(5-phosphoribosyl)-5-[Succinivibrio sp.]|nr:1-(5-phosphoribosyl)-5-[(5-phosphoribosylamino)methylideneamino] imidazole-4-carboxamide isomerase [Succinivibrio sp.]
MIIPALDLLGGQVVRLRQGDYARSTVFEVDPLRRIREAAAQGAQLVHLVDLQGAREPQRRQLSLIASLVKASPLPIETGGGIRSLGEVKALLRLGVERVVIGSLAVTAPQLVRGWLRCVGPERVVLAVDVRLSGGVPYAATHGWLETSDLTFDQVLRPFMPYKIRHVLVTDISRDGMMRGANHQLYRQLAERYPSLDLIASGGISSLDDLQEVARSGASSVVLGRSLLEGRFSVKEALQCWPDA